MSRSFVRLAVAGGLVCIAAAQDPALAQNWFERQFSPQSGQSGSGPSASEISEMSVRIDRLEEMVRRLNGELEELRHQIATGRGAAAPASLAQPQPQALAQPAPTSPPSLPPPASAQQQSSFPANDSSTYQGAFDQGAFDQGASAAQGTIDQGSPTSLLPPSPYLPDGAQARGTPPQTLGTLPGSTLRGSEGAAAPPPAPDQQFAAVPDESGPEAAYKNAHALLLQEDFEAAEYGFATFLDEFPNHQLAGNAQYWLAESYYRRGDYRQAAQGFLKGYQAYASSPKAPDSLLRLGMTLAALGQTEQACASFAEVGSRFPNADPAIRENAAAERRRAGC